MKLNNISLTLIAAALLPTFAYAGMDTISTSGSHCNRAAITTTVTVAERKADPIEQEVNNLVNSTDDPVLASYYRDLYTAPIQRETIDFVRTPDPYVDALSMAFYGSVEPDSLLAAASTTTTVAVAERKADPMEVEVNNLVNSTDDPVLASYYRDLYTAPIPHQTIEFVRAPDPYVEALAMAFYGPVESSSRLVC